MSEHLRSCIELQILKLGGSSIDHLAECPNSRKQSVTDPQCNNAGQVGLGRSCALPKFTWPVSDRTKTNTQLLGVHHLLAGVWAPLGER